MAPRANWEGLSSAVAGFLSHRSLSGVVSERKGEFQPDKPENWAPLEAAERAAVPLCPTSTILPSKIPEKSSPGAAGPRVLSQVSTSLAE
jgi:hypothetical protein